MTNLTITLNEAVIRQARIRAIQQGTSVSAKVREFLAAYAAGVSHSESSDGTTELMRMMSAVRGEIEQTKKRAAGADTPATSTAPSRRTLRDEMYQGDFRARARTEAAVPRARRKSAT